MRYPYWRIAAAVTTVTDAGAWAISCENFEAVDVSFTSSSCSMVSVEGSGTGDWARAVAGTTQANGGHERREPRSRRDMKG